MVDTASRVTGWLVAATVLGAAHAAVSVTWARVLAWAAAAVLVLHGGALTLVPGVVLSGVADVAVEETSALRWHTFLWDPWFLAWGACSVVALAATRRVRR